MNKKYIVKLTDEERQQLQSLVNQGKTAARKMKRAWILLQSDMGTSGPCWSDEKIQQAYGVSLVTIYRVRQELVEEGFESVLTRQPKSRHRHRKLDGDQEAHLIAPPAGRCRWTLRLLASKMVELQWVQLRFLQAESGLSAFFWVIFWALMALGAAEIIHGAYSNRESSQTRLEVCSMKSQNKSSAKACPVTSESVSDDAKKILDGLIEFCKSSDSTFGKFERELLVHMALLGRCLIRLFLTARHERLDVQPFLKDEKYRNGDPYAKRTLKTFYGKVAYGRRYLQPYCDGGSGIFPLDIVLGLTRDSLSPWMMQWVARLATRMSFKASKMVCKAVLNWAPATETIEQVVLGMGREAAPFMAQQDAPKEDGEVLVIEIDGKCAPTATEAELTKRRGKRKPKCDKDCKCGCQRHRGKAKRKARGAQGGKKRRKKGDKSKNGKEAIVLEMYTLTRGEDGLLHGPGNKRLYATFAGRKAAALWARAQATKRGFGPDTTKTVQIVMDGAKRLYTAMQEQFPNAIFTLDVIHVVERLWKLGRKFHAEGSDELKAWVENLKRLVYAGRAKALVKRLRQYLRDVPINGPGTKSRRKALQTEIGYIGRRVEMMCYREWRKLDLVIASGQVEGAVRQLVGERFDCAGMRWRKGKAEALLHLRCIELNGDWEEFATWFERNTQNRLRKGERRKVLTDQPIILKIAA